MDFEWVAIALGDVVWIAVAFAFGLLARTVGLPPLVGFLATGFLLHAQGIASGEMLQKLADLGITLLLFTVGLKINLATLARPQVWGVAGLHGILIVLLFDAGLMVLATTGLPLFSELTPQTSMLIAFALTFSSTVFVVKVLEERGEMKSLHGRIAIGILIFQDLIAVGFLAISEGKVPSLWALSLILVFPLSPLLHRLLNRVDHGELLVLYAFVLALGGAEWFELVGLKGDLGALVAGILVANHPRSPEMARTMLGFKDLFLLGFFLSIGLSGQPTVETFFAGALIAFFVGVKSILYFVLLSRFRLRARTSLLTASSLTNYSEFGLIVIAVAVSHGWIDNQWLIAMAIAVSLSFAMSAILNERSNRLYTRYRTKWQQWQRHERLADDPPLDTGDATIVVIGMGRVGTGAYDEMRQRKGETVVGVDSDPVKVRQHQEVGRKVLLGDPSDADFWDRVSKTHSVRLMMLALPHQSINLSVLEQLELSHFDVRVAATARYPDEVEALKEAGANTVYNIYTEAGAGFAAHVTGEQTI